MCSLIDFGKAVCTALFAWVLAIFTNYQDAFMTLFVGFTLNILMGLGADININGRAFSLKKAKDALLLLMFYFLLIIFIHVALSGQYASMGSTMITWLTYIVGYFI